MFDWSLNLLRFTNRVTAHLALLDDQYPSTDEEQAIHLDIPYPDARRMHRLLPPVTGRYPRSLFRFLAPRKL